MPGHWWDLALECGHQVQRTARRRGEEWRPAPKRAACPECPRAVYLYVKVEAMTEAGLTPDQLLATADFALTELALAKSLVIFHGERVGARRYFETGGLMRLDAAGNAWAPVTLGGVKISRSA